MARSLVVSLRLTIGYRLSWLGHERKMCVHGHSNYHLVELPDD
ncbi:MAG: hypothetical protein WCJ40_11250 [Planctomycetota bacterium]